MANKDPNTPKPDFERARSGKAKEAAETERRRPHAPMPTPAPRPPESIAKPVDRQAFADRQAQEDLHARLKQRYNRQAAKDKDEGRGR